MKDLSELRSDQALLVAVPYEHLDSAAKSFGAEVDIAFGTNTTTPFELQQVLGGEPCPLLIYASHSPTSSEPRVTWAGLFVGSCDPNYGKHPLGAPNRPPSTAKDSRWLQFWKVRSLRKLSESEQLSIAALRGAGNSKNFLKTFKPERPMIIDNPL